MTNQLQGRNNSSEHAIFSLTADQRHLLGDDVYLRTHYPIRLRQYKSNGVVQEMNEDELLQQILDSDRVAPGNRLWALYGAAGSGKSELMKWLSVRIGHDCPSRESVMLRIARTELDVLSITRRFSTLLSSDLVSESTELRWEEARMKPRTVTKILLLYALENLLDSDETINALFYRLTNALQPFIEEILEVGEKQYLEESLELLSQETWDAVISETAIAVPLDYELFRHHLDIAFRNHLLEGFSLPDTMKRIADKVQQEKGMRPILLVDDLVQSLNLFATDLLDYLITLEAGNWDVVFGLTPAAFDSSLRGRRLLERIAHLDTIDDRVEKLWLSDETGQDSYVLNEENCHHFVAPYLREYYVRKNVSVTSELYPFNREALVRIYRGLPHNKGKVRYFLKHIREILVIIDQGVAPQHAISPYAVSEVMARCSDPNLAAICEVYGPLIDSNETQQVLLSATILQRFDMPSRDVIVQVEPLQRKLEHQTQSQIIEDETTVAIRDWLRSQSVNRQLLTGLRRGIVKWLRAIYPPDIIARPYVASPHRILRWRDTYLRASPPICFEGVDDDMEGIVITRKLGTTAFDLYHYSTANGAKAKQLAKILANSSSLAGLVFEAAVFNKKLREQLVMELEMSIEDMVLGLYCWRLIANGEPKFQIPGFPSEFWAELQRCRNGIRAESKLNADMVRAIDFVFDDFFRLRKNLYDGLGIQSWLHNRTIADIVSSIESLNIDRIDPRYQLGKKTLKESLTIIQSSIKSWRATDSSVDQNLHHEMQSLINRFRGDAQVELPLHVVSLGVWKELRSSHPGIFESLLVRLAVE